MHSVSMYVKSLILLAVFSRVIVPRETRIKTTPTESNNQGQGLPSLRGPPRVNQPTPN
jgi:hypothetical protein